MDAADDDKMPELKLTHDSNGDIEVDLTGNPDTDTSGIPELTEDIVVDQDVASPEDHQTHVGDTQHRRG